VKCCLQGSARIYTEVHEVHWLRGILHGYFDHIRAFILAPKETVVREIGRVGPVDQVTRRKDANGVLLGVSDYHHPFLSWSVPYDLGVAEVE
jgi:hypothetical protein